MATKKEETAIVAAEQMEQVGDMQVFTNEGRNLDLDNLFNSNSGFFTTLDETSPTYEYDILEIMGDPDERLINHVNEIITIDGFYVEIVDLPNDQTGVFEPAPRIIIKDTKGVRYGCVSTGVLSFLRRLMYIKKRNIKGTKVKIIQVTSRNGNRPLSLQVVK